LIWTWSLLLIALAIAFHACGVVMIALVGVRVRGWARSRHLTTGRGISIVIGVVAATGALLAMLHAIEAAIWAAAYLWLGAVNSPVDALLFSLGALTTYGGSGLTPQQPWLMMAALQAADGVLLFGISTAYMFAVMQAYWPLLSPPPESDVR
jgi:hypothetical protein